MVVIMYQTNCNIFQNDPWLAKTFITWHEKSHIILVEIRLKKNTKKTIKHMYMYCYKSEKKEIIEINYTS